MLAAEVPLLPKLLLQEGTSELFHPYAHHQVSIHLLLLMTPEDAFVQMSIVLFPHRPSLCTLAVNPSSLSDPVH
jgi:hypothetical protein